MSVLLVQRRNSLISRIEGVGLVVMTVCSVRIRRTVISVCL
jgi:hypothetical protein